MGADELGVQKLDAIVFGNAVKPDELFHVREALADDGFALVPVCLRYLEKSIPGGAAKYCEGFWWQIGKTGRRSDPDAPGSDDKKLWWFPSTMRPIRAKSEKIPEKVRALWL